MYARVHFQSRFAPPALLAVVVTVGLLLVMQSLIRTERAVLSDAPMAGKLTFLRELPDVPHNDIDRTPPEPPTPPDPEPPRPQTAEFTNHGGTIPVTFTPTQSRTEWRPRELGDGGLTRTFMPAPVYPERAAMRGIEGYVVVSFAVSEGGFVTDVEVVEADPPGVFEQAAIEAVRRSRYRPQVEDGRPVPVRGVVQRLTFELATR